MYFHHLHFYVRDTAFWTQWFEHKLSFQQAQALTPHGSSQSFGPSRPSSTARSQAAVQAIGPTILTQGNIEIRLSSPQHSCEVAAYLKQHPPGLVDVAFATTDVTAALRQAQQQGAVVLQPIHTNSVGQRQCQLKGWADLCHTLIEVDATWIARQSQTPQPIHDQPLLVSLIDHVVINVPRGELHSAVTWYQQVFGFQLGQSFEINTANSGLCSQVLVHPVGPLQLPINEPSSENSQIQEFLHHNRGAGVQHVALRTPDAISAIAQFRHQGLDLLQVPTTYYEALNQRTDRPIQDLTDISRQQLLLDWTQGGQAGMLLQTFTQPIFPEPTFFFEVIERSDYRENGKIKTAQGFGEGNFQALFEAIERAQMQRGSL